MMFAMKDAQFQLVYNVLSFALASMMATTLFLWMRVPSINPRYRTALIISGMVTFIAAYHYMRIFNSWVEAYSYSTDKVCTDRNGCATQDPMLTGIPFNDAYRYMDWLLTVPMLLMEIVLVMNLPEDQATTKCMTLGVAAALMIIIGYPGELIVEGNLSKRWHYWAGAMVPFCYIVNELLVGLASATNSEPDEKVKALVLRSQWVTVVSWLTYPVVYVFPMMGLSGSSTVVAIQCGYCASDIISKCGVGLIIYSITAAKSQIETKGALLP
jgi:bacteriorhodopsin